MKSVMLFMLIATIAFSCKKENGPKELNGKWKMTEYYDRSTNSTNRKPAASEDVYLEISGNTFKAFSPTATYSEGTYTLTADKILFTKTTSNFAITNDLWTDIFIWAVEACMLQSVYPCKPSTITWYGSRKIKISTPLRMDITLEK